MLSGSKAPLIRIQYPLKEKISYSTPRHYFVGTVDTFQVKQLELTRSAQRSDQLYSKPGTIRDSFLRMISNLFSKDFQITNLELIVHPSKPGQKDVKLTASFAPQARIDRNLFWRSKEFRGIYETVMNDTSFRSIDLKMSGRVVSILDIAKRRAKDKLGDFFILRTELEAGVNDYSLRALDADFQILEEHTYSFVYKADVDGETNVPSGYESSKFHTAAQEQNCASCHRMKPNAAELASTSATVRMCYPCHIWVTSTVKVHAPTSEWNCFLCHSAAPNGESGFDVPSSKKNEKMCTSCHEDLKDELEKAKFSHAPAASGECLSCHNPHGSDFRGMAVMQPNTLCLSCHEKKYAKDHPVMQHPIHGVQDTKSPKQELSCVSCHSPHTGANEKLFQKATGVFELCQECHKK